MTEPESCSKEKGSGGMAASQSLTHGSDFDSTAFTKSSNY